MPDNAHLKNLFFNLSHLIGDDIIAFVSRVNPDRVFLDKYLERYAFAGELGVPPEQLAFPLQVHSNRVKLVSSSGSVENTDGLITNNPSLVLSIVTADCLPVFIYDPVDDYRALVHAGWRGISTKIIPHAVKQLIELGVKPESLQFIYGPSIRQENYEVGEDVAAKFSPENKLKISDDSWKVNLAGEVTNQILDFSIPAENIHDCGICTFEEQDCHSYRRDGHRAGRMYSFFGRTNESV